MASAAVVLIAAGMFGIWAWQQNQAFNQANQSPAPTKTTPKSIPDAPKVVRSDDPFEGQGETTITHIPEWASPTKLTDRMKAQALAKAKAEAEAEVAGQLTTDPSVPQYETPAFERLAQLDRKPSDNRVLANINRSLREGWSAAKLTPTDSVGDATWFRRVSDTLLGRLPTDAEKKAFADSRDREATLELLLASDKFSQHWASRFADVLVGKNASNVNRDDLEAYLANSLRSDKPYDQLAFELITAQGTTNSDAEDYNPAVNFLLAYQDNTAGKVSATEKVCQVFLGKQMQCSRCHDHPSDKVAQQQYWELAAYFTQMQSTSSDALFNKDYSGSNNALDDADLFYETASKVGKVAYPRFLDGTELETKSGRVEDVNRRVELANAIVQSREFAEATINRLWSQVFRASFTYPVDDMGTHNKPSQDELLTGLASDFINSEFNIRSAMKWMLMSSAFDRKMRLNSDPLAMRTDAFSSFARQIPVSYPAIDNALARMAKARAANSAFDPTQLLANMGNDGSKLTDEQKSAELRRIASKVLRERMLSSTKRDGLLLNLTEDRKLTDDQLLEHLFYYIVGRAPSQAELRSGRMLLQSRSKLKALQEIGWILLNSDEYKSQH